MGEVHDQFTVNNKVGVCFFGTGHPGCAPTFIFSVHKKKTLFSKGWSWWKCEEKTIVFDVQVSWGKSFHLLQSYSLPCLNAVPIKGIYFDVWCFSFWCLDLEGVKMWYDIDTDETFTTNTLIIQYSSGLGKSWLRGKNKIGDNTKVLQKAC